MMKVLTLCLALLCVSALRADPLPQQNIANMVARSDAVMDAGLCVVANDTSTPPGATITLLLPQPVGPRRILVADYNWIRAAGYLTNPATGRWVMSERIEQACTADALSSRCFAARSLWKQESQ